MRCAFKYRWYPTSEQAALLTQWKRETDTGWLNEVSAVPLQQTLRHQQAALGRFFDKKARYPKFKSKRRSKASAEFTRSAFRWRDGHLYLAKLDEPLGIVLVASAARPNRAVDRDRVA